MAILDTEKVDFLWKRIIFGVTKTAGALVKFGSNETIPSPAPVLPSSIWRDGDTIPAAPAHGGAVAAHVANTRIAMTTDPTAPPFMAWIATATQGNLSTRLKDFIAPTFGPGYAVKVYLGDPESGNAARIFQDTTNEEFIFDYSAGVLIFTGIIPSNKPATIGDGNFSATANGVFIELYRYVGAKGAGGSGGASAIADLTDVDLGSALADGQVLVYRQGVWQPENSGGGPGGAYGTMALQDADDIDVTGGKLDNVTLTNVTIDGGTF